MLYFVCMLLCASLQFMFAWRLCSWSRFVSGFHHIYKTTNLPQKPQGRCVSHHIRQLPIRIHFVLSFSLRFKASAGWVALDSTAYSDSLCRSCDDLGSWPPPESVPTPSASLSLGRKSHRSSVESPCRSGPPSRLKSSGDGGRKDACQQKLPFQENIQK